MREIEWSTAFKKDIRRESKGPNLTVLNANLPVVLGTLSNDAALPAQYKDHKLTGEWEGCRECHLKANLLLVYEMPDDKILRLVRLGSHAELFGI
ncbi:MAG: type II toxin-antitoxin system YafQ family toxin [Synergistaceae bacterium]|nr:type II toxin-antitoxin system YafQ family toxin [Synergistaceae bacterium]